VKIKQHRNRSKNKFRTSPIVLGIMAPSLPLDRLWKMSVTSCYLYMNTQH